MSTESLRSLRGIASRRRAQAIAHTVIWAASILTIAVLFLIIGFIVVRGFYSDNIKNYDVLSVQDSSFDGMELVLNDKIRMKDMTFNSLADAFTGEYIDWGKLSEQAYDLVPCLPDPATPEGKKVLDALGIVKTDLTPMAASFPSFAEVLSKVASTPGAFAVVPAGSALPAHAKRIDVRRMVMAANPSVVRLVGNAKLKLLNETQIKTLFTGGAANWKELGGLDLPVVVVRPPAGSPLAAEAEKAGLADANRGADRAVVAGSADEQYRLTAEKTGAVTLMYYKDAKARKLSTIGVERTERGPNLTLRYLFEPPKMSGRVGGISSIIVNTLIMILLTLLIATPIGVSAAIYLVEYSRQSRLVTILRLGTETLAGVPSIIFGLFGMIFFVNILGWGIGLLSGVLTLTLMILPTVVRTSEEALKTVPMSMREGSLALGATKLQTVLRVAVPAAMPGILTGVILSLGRAVGETAALIFTMGSNYETATNLFSSARVLSVHVYLIVAEGISMDKAFATATILVFIILIVNLTTVKLIGRFNTMAGKQ